MDMTPLALTSAAVAIHLPVGRQLHQVSSLYVCLLRCVGPPAIGVIELAKQLYADAGVAIYELEAKRALYMVPPL